MAHRHAGADGRCPLFVTRYSLSPKTAIGIQTRHYLNAFPDWLHLHWREYGSPVREHRRSLRLENLLVGKWPGYAAKVRRVPGLRRWGEPVWRGNALDERTSRKLARRFENKVGAIYVAPIDGEDAERMRHIVELLGRPFVLHFWDSLVEPLLQSEHTRWLIEHAHSVLVLSKPLLAEARQLRPDAGELLFVREPTASRAKAPAGREPLRVALIGFLPAYRTGLHLLHEASVKMRAAGLTMELHFVGSARALERLREPEITREMISTGHLRSNAARDAALASCHVAFLPGPLVPPVKDMRSRYSIPSRVLDFMAVGLPVVGTVHPGSATAQFYAEYGVGEHLLCGSAEDVVRAFAELREPGAWHEAHRASLAALEKIDCAGQLETLKAAIVSAAASV